MYGYRCTCRRMKSMSAFLEKIIPPGSFATLDRLPMPIVAGRRVPVI